MLSCSIWFSAPSFWMGGGLESRCVRCGWCRTALSSTCFGYIRPSSGALDVELQHMVFCNSTSNVPDDGCMYPKHVELRIHQ